jgi:hypothetical protein
MILDLAEWHATCLWLEDDGTEPVTLALDGSVRIHPLDRPDTILAACIADLTSVAAAGEAHLR